MHCLTIPVTRARHPKAWGNTVRLPFAERAFVPDAKITEYLLNPNHPEGGAKAHFFLGVGFRREHPEVFRAALLALASSSDVVASDHPAGVKYVGTGVVQTPKGTGIGVLHVWLADDEHSPPRLVTAYPAPGRVR